MFPAAANELLKKRRKSRRLQAELRASGCSSSELAAGGLQIGQTISSKGTLTINTMTERGKPSFQ